MPLQPSDAVVMLVQLERYIARRYGRKAGVHRHFLYWAVSRAGGMNEYKNVSWAGVKRLVFVCAGNICRSPYAEFKARSLGLQAASFGLQSDGRSPAHPDAARIAARRGVDLDPHRSRSHTMWTPQPGDLLIGMEPKHGRALRAIRGPCEVTLLGLWSTPPRPYIQDPNGLGDEYFATCFDCIDSAIERLASLCPNAFS